MSRVKWPDELVLRIRAPLSSKVKPNASKAGQKRLTEGVMVGWHH